MLRLLLPVLLVLAQAVTAFAQSSNSPLIDSLLHGVPTFRDSIAANSKDFELQVLYRPLAGPDSGSTHHWGNDASHYFYPASTVKLPVAILALEAIAKADIIDLTSHSAMEVDSARAPQSASTQRVGMPSTPSTIAGHVTDIGVVSSNEAYNRMFGWLGPRYINDQLWQRGYRTRLVHRLSAPGFTTEENMHLNPVAFRGEQTGDTVYYRGAAFAKTQHAPTLQHERKGVGYFDDATETVVADSFDFSHKNFLALEDLADILQAVVAPSTVDFTKRFELRPSDREHLLSALSTRPADSDNPLHHEHPDGYLNFLYYGGGGDYDSDGPLIYNKVGDAYGTLTDAAVFCDPITKQPLFLLAATLLVNQNQIFNDGIYEYDTIGFPFFKELVRAFWALR